MKHWQNASFVVVTLVGDKHHSIAQDGSGFITSSGWSQTQPSYLPQLPECWSNYTWVKCTAFIFYENVYLTFTYIGMQVCVCVWAHKHEYGMRPEAWDVLQLEL